VSDPVRVPIRAEHDIVVARQEGRTIAQQAGFTGSSLTLIATAISEIARNIVLYAGQGEMELGPCGADGRRGIEVIARDQGPGIPDVEKAMQDGYSTGRGLGLGLPGARRLMDEFEIRSAVGQGTTVIMRKWVR
jgi:serine/threonine-protein kinase RsbT